MTTELPDLPIAELAGLIAARKPVHDRPQRHAPPAYFSSPAVSTRRGRVRRAR
jgi:hypothetical protein